MLLVLFQSRTTLILIIVRKAEYLFKSLIMFPSNEFITVLFHFALRMCLSEGRENPIIHCSLLHYTYVPVWMLDELKI